jgi:hypothetical protein
MAKSKNDKYESAKNNYDAQVEEYTGTKGYEKGVAAAQKQGNSLADSQMKSGREQGQLNFLTAQNLGSAGLGNVQDANRTASNYSQEQNRLANSEAKKYAADQAALAASGAQSQATTAARAAGLNKAQAAMMGAQQNSNAYQNAIGNAYSQQLNQANNSYENQANRAIGSMESARNLAANQISGATNTYGQNQSQQQNAMQSANNSAVSAAGTGMSSDQQEGQAEYERKWGNWGNGLGIGGSLLKSFSDEDLKHYRECSKKVTIRSPKSIEKLKFVKEGTK